METKIENNSKITFGIDNDYLAKYTQEVILPAMFEYVGKNEKLLIKALTKIVEVCNSKEEVIKCLNKLCEQIDKELE